MSSSSERLGTGANVSMIMLDTIDLTPYGVAVHDPFARAILQALVGIILAVRVSVMPEGSGNALVVALS